MRNALILTGIWLGILVSAYAIVFWDKDIDRPLPISLLEEQGRSAASEYVHPDGLFSLQIPLGWKVEENVEYVEMTDPNSNITVWVVAVDATGLDASLDVALASVDLGTEFIMMPSAILEDAWEGDDISVIYQSESGDEVLHVRVQRPETISVVMLARGQEKVLEALTGNIDWIWAELAIPADEFLLL